MPEKSNYIAVFIAIFSSIFGALIAVFAALGKRKKREAIPGSGSSYPGSRGDRVSHNVKSYNQASYRSDPYERYRDDEERRRKVSIIISILVGLLAGGLFLFIYLSRRG